MYTSIGENIEMSSLARQLEMTNPTLKLRKGRRNNIDTTNRSSATDTTTTNATTSNTTSTNAITANTPIAPQNFIRSQISSLGNSLCFIENNIIKASKVCYEYIIILI